MRAVGTYGPMVMTLTGLVFVVRDEPGVRLPRVKGGLVRVDV